MAKVLTEDMLSDIVKDGPMQFFRHTEDKGAVEVVFTSSITHTEPGEIDMFGNKWEPRVTDENGMPIIDERTGKPREAWAKTEATCLIKGAPHIYSFSAKSLLRAFAAVLNEQEDVSNETLAGSKWSIARTGKWDWSIQYLGREDIDELKPEDKNSGSDIKEVLTKFKNTNEEKVKAGLKKNQLIQYICFETDMKPANVETKLDELNKEGFLSIDDNGLVILK